MSPPVGIANLADSEAGAQLQSEPSANLQKVRARLLPSLLIRSPR
jgi:hypothetical protein